MKKLSIVVPCYNEQENVYDFYQETQKYVKEIQAEIEFVFIDDGSKDQTLSILRDLANHDENVNFISFSRNFGKESAILAGFHYATGDAVILMDVDLQHPPSLIPIMWKYYEEGYDQVIGKRNRKGEGFWRRHLTNLYYKVANQLVEISITNGVGDFRLLSRRALNAVLKMSEYNRFSKGLFAWIGFHEKLIEYDNQVRMDGNGKWSFKSLLNYGIDGVLSFNTKPLRVAIHGGTYITIAGFIYIFLTLINYFLHGIETPGYFTTISAIIILGGVQLLFLGIIGEYIGRIYCEIKDRPHYLIQEKRVKE
ncbi:glycosyltransferase family 2 protein [Oceanobacillus halophilus]|uniref:Glycosyltransferase n=1 Tax=Oceanobacillus halophilus TaxID=930130 RepID=A0A495A428_9BACI|nr:glycosyltransferase family 2 protein [Oceanobacillus halophilus]RKQ34296.1 glycosyltransferase [Oceanobacillus halophilus]